MYIYRNQPTLNRPHDLKGCLCFTEGMKFDMEDRSLAEESICDWLPENYRPDIESCPRFSKLREEWIETLYFPKLE